MRANQTRQHTLHQSIANLYEKPHTYKNKHATNMLMPLSQLLNKRACDNVAVIESFPRRHNV